MNRLEAEIVMQFLHFFIRNRTFRHVFHLFLGVRNFNAESIEHKWFGYTDKMYNLFTALQFDRSIERKWTLNKHLDFDSVLLRRKKDNQHVCMQWEYLFWKEREKKVQNNIPIGTTTAAATAAVKYLYCLVYTKKTPFWKICCFDRVIETGKEKTQMKQQQTEDKNSMCNEFLCTTYEWLKPGSLHRLSWFTAKWQWNFAVKLKHGSYDRISRSLSLSYPLLLSLTLKVTNEWECI